MAAHDIDDLGRTAEDLLRELATPHLPEARRERLCERLVRMYLPLAADIARCYRGRGEPLDDLLQAACLGLMKAIAGFDAGLGHEFRGYAAITMSGEVKRHFRDHTWAVKVPGRYQVRRSELNRLVADLSQVHGRSPTVADLAAGMGLSREEVLLTLDAAAAYSALSLDAPIGADEDDPLAALLDKYALKPLLAALPARERTIVLLRFYGNLTQEQIAAELGISQMHVSRLLRAVLDRLRAELVS
ncbi:hypothetical protein GCM10022419_113960 [Nonomuraea rosea]|uniref:SigB/SigF/SigG family RNA polymerase sigma factor n=1 Tax=Nonomuraea rosea TaxID=638574 RepID=A0ABP6ZJX3_9ACTN